MAADARLKAHALDDLGSVQSARAGIRIKLIESRNAKLTALPADVSSDISTFTRTSLLSFRTLSANVLNDAENAYSVKTYRRALVSPTALSLPALTMLETCLRTVLSVTPEIPATAVIVK